MALRGSSHGLWEGSPAATRASGRRVMHRPGGRLLAHGPWPAGPGPCRRCRAGRFGAGGAGGHARCRPPCPMNRKPRSCLGAAGAHLCKCCGSICGVADRAVPSRRAAVHMGRMPGRRLSGARTAASPEARERPQARASRARAGACIAPADPRRPKRSCALRARRQHACHHGRAGAHAQLGKDAAQVGRDRPFAAQRIVHKRTRGHSQVPRVAG